MMQVLQRLNQLGFCLSYSQTLRNVKELGKDYDALVKHWKNGIEVLDEDAQEIDIGSGHEIASLDSCETDEDFSEAENWTSEDEDIQDASTSGQ